VRGIAALVILAALAACHSSSGPDVGVTVSPQAPSVVEGTQQAFTAAVTGTANTAVTWSVDQGVAGGTISASGVYSAPMTTGTFQVRATSVADPTQSAAANVSVTGPLPATTLATGVSGIYAAAGSDVLYTVQYSQFPPSCWFVSRAGAESQVACIDPGINQTFVPSAGYIVASSVDVEDVPPQYGINAIAPDNTSEPLRIGQGFASLNRVRWPWVLYFYNGAGYYPIGPTEYLLFNAITGQTYTITPPNPTGLADFVVSGSVISVYFATTTDIEQWDTQSQVSTSLASPASAVASLVADGGLLAWADGASHQVLHAINLGDGTATTLSSTMTQYFLSGGLLAWQEEPLSAPDSVKQFDGTTVTTIASSNVTLFGTDSGYVLYATAVSTVAMLWARNAAGTQLVANNSASALITTNLVYYIDGDGQLEVATLP
jgi:hypothetical protein